MTEKVLRISKFDEHAVAAMRIIMPYTEIPIEVVESYFDIITKLKNFQNINEKRKTELQHKINFDEKTNLLKYNCNYLTEILASVSRTLSELEAPDYPITFVRIDIDDFSKFNNTYGHHVGDIILKKIAKIIKSSTRITDYAIRFGGEEFDIIFPATKLDEAKVIISDIFRQIRKLKISHEGNFLTTSVSAGISSLTFPLFSIRRIFPDKTIQQYQLLQQKADNALYEAKYLGKNQYCIYDRNKKKDYELFRQKYTKVI